jgi:hypothetical protein
MRLIPISLIIFWIIIITAPEILAYLLGGFFVFLGINGLILWGLFSKVKKGGDDNYVKFGKYKIYR